MITLPDLVPVQLQLRSADAFLLRLARLQWRTLLAGLLLGNLWMLAQAALPVVVGRTIDAGVNGHDGRALAIGSAVVVGVGLLTAASGTARHRFAVTNWLLANSRTRQALGYHIAEHGTTIAARTTTGEVVETVGTDSHRLADLFDLSARGGGAVGAYLVVAVLLVRMDPLVGLWVAVGMPALSGTLAGVLRPLQKRQRQHRAREGELTALGADTVAGIRVLRGIGGEEQFLTRYRDRSQQVRAAGVRVAGLQAGLDAAHVLLPGIFIVVLTWLAAHAALDGRLTAGQLVTIYGVAAFLRLPLETTTEVLSKAIRARVAAGRVIAVLTQVGQPAGGQQPPMPPPGSPVHDQDSGLTLDPALFTGVVTADPEQAAAIADRLGALDTDPDRQRILVSEAEPRLFTGTLRGELDPGGEHSDVDLLAALAVADASDLLETVPAGLDSRVEERGREFSGGQRQRLVLARAVLADPEILVLVEPTSAVDAHTEARVAQRLRSARTGRTTMVTTASPLLLDLCDRVAFVAAGRVSAVGTHRELLRDSAGYRRVVLRGSENEDDDGAASSDAHQPDEVTL